MPFQTPAELYKAIRRDYELLEGWRTLYANFEGEYRGAQSGFGKKKRGGKRPVNLIQEFVDGALPDLVPEEVIPAVTAKRADATVDADVLNIDLEQQFSEMGLVDEVENAAHELLFAPIVLCEMGRHEGCKTVEVDGERFSLTEAFCKVHRFSDICVDLEAVKWKDRRYAAVRVLIRRDQAIAQGIFGKDPVIGPDGMPQEDPNSPPVLTKQEAADFLNGIGTNREGSGDMRSPIGEPEEDDKLETVQLWRVAIYEGNDVHIAYINDAEGQPTKWLYHERHRGHPMGPFSCARARWASDSMLGPPLISAIADVHDACVALGNKMVKQLMNLKNIAVGRKDARDDAMRIQESEDSNIVLLDDPEPTKNIQIGGISKEFPGGLAWLQQQFGNQAGNIRQVAGTEGGADTATVASYMQQGGRQRLRRSAMKLKRMLDDVCAFVAFALVFDRGEGGAGIPGYREVELKLPTGEVIPMVLKEGLEADEAAADILRFTFKIQSWATQIVDPNMKAARVTEFIGTCQSMLPLIQAGLFKPSAPARLGQQVFGLTDIDAYMPDLTGERSMVQQLAFSSTPTPPMATPGAVGGQGGQPRGPQNQIGAVRSAMAPTTPTAPPTAAGASPVGY